MGTLDTRTARPLPPPVAAPALPANPTSPPPPPSVAPQPSAFQLQLLGGLFALGALLALVGGRGAFRYHLHVELGGMFFAAYSALVALSWLRPGVLTRRVDKLLDRWVRNSATGYYGVMALGVSFSLEIANFFDNLLHFELDVQRMILERVMRFSVQSLENFIKAMAWPGLVLSSGQLVGAAVLVGATWGVFRVTAKVLPQAAFRKREKKVKNPAEVPVR
jgi:hypothetical protein